MANSRKKENFNDIEQAVKNIDTEKNRGDKGTEDDDPWKVTSISVSYTPWDELSRKEKILRVLGYFVKTVLVIGCLYMFICSLDFLSSAFRLLGGEAAGKVFQQSDIMTNPVAGLMIGVLVTVLVQSSSTSTSVVVSMVGAGILNIRTAIPIVMGANIGTSVTNTIVAMGQIGDKGEFRRAFAGATVHDMFNWLTVIVLLPIEVISGYLFHLTEAIVNSLPLKQEKGANKDMLKVITTPFTDRIIQVNKDAITKIAHGIEDALDHDRAIMKLCCDKSSPSDCCKDTLKSIDFIQTGVSYTSQQKRDVCKQLGHCTNQNSEMYLPGCLTIPWSHASQKTRTQVKGLDCSIFRGTQNETDCCQLKMDGSGAHEDISETCNSISSCFSSDSHDFTTSACVTSLVNVTEVTQAWSESFSCVRWIKDVLNHTCKNECDFLLRGLYPTLNEKAIGGILLVISLIILCVCLVCIVKLLHSLLQGPMALIIKKFINADFPGRCGYFTGYLAIVIGACLTIIVQSSSVFTSALTPFVGIGVIELDRMYPLTLGSNIGTTTTAILSALTTSSDHIRNALQVAFCHLFFNISGIILFYPIPALRFPLPLARFLGNRTATYRWYAIVYILIMFFIFPAAIFALSIPGWYVLLGVLGPFLLLAVLIGIIKCLQAKQQNRLPKTIRNWKFLPKALRSLEPYDKVMQKIFFCKKFQYPRDVAGMLKNLSFKRSSKTKSGINLQTVNTRL